MTSREKAQIQGVPCTGLYPRRTPNPKAAGGLDRQPVVGAVPRSG
nr:MAG TPA_asm: hypothetical protein [Caudoviricetes sp.]